MKKILVILMGWLCCWGLSACAAVTPTTEGTKLPPTHTATAELVTTPEPLGTATATLQANVTRGPWPTHRPSWTPGPPTITPIPIQTIPGTIPQCSGGGKILEWSGNEDIGGVVLYQKIDTESYHYYNEGLWLGDIQDLSNRSVQLESSRSVATARFSPDGKSLAYLPVYPEPLVTRELVIINNNWKKKIFQWTIADLDSERERMCGENCKVKSGSRIIIGSAMLDWVNNHLIQITYPLTRVKSGFLSDRVTHMYDLFESAWKYYSIENKPFYGEYYLSPNETSIYTIYSHPEIFDLSNGEKFEFSNIYLDGFSKVHWSPDSKKVVLGTQGAYYIVEGKVIRQIVSKNLPFPEYYGVPVSNFTWSPDSRYIIFSLSSNYYIYDSEKNEYVYSCPMERSFSNVGTWSQDEKWFLISGVDYDQSQYDIQLVNIETGNIYILLDSAISWGWSEEFPLAETP